MSNIPDGYSVIPGSGQAVAEAIVKAVDATEGALQSDVLYSPTTGFIVPDAVAKKFKAPKNDTGLDVNAPASELSIEPPAESTGISTSYAAGESPDEVEEVETEEAEVPKPNDDKANVVTSDSK